MTSRTLLCTTGTSIAQGCKALIDFQKRASTWDEPTPELTAQIRERLNGLDLTTEAGRVRASAELNALQRLPADSGDEVVLLTTDTADGRACAEAVREVLIEQFEISRVAIERIEGLQVRDSDLLRREGLANLTRKLVHYLDDPQRRHGGGCVLCPNGGFKGVVPFLTILGMIYRAPVVYVFEFAETLIKLPPLPIGFATDLFERAMPALRWAANEGVFDPEVFYRLIPGFARDEQEWFDSFLEVVPDASGQPLASLSPLAEVLAQREGGPHAELMLSSQARADFAKLSGPDRRDVVTHLRKLTSPLWRSQHRDTKYNNDLDFFPRGHNPWRFAGFTKEGKFHLCWFARHAEYERRLPLPTSQQAAFKAGDFAVFESFEMPEISDVECDITTDADHGKTWQEIRAERNESLASLSQISQKLDRTRKELHEANEKIHRLKQAPASIKSKNAKATRPQTNPIAPLLGAQPFFQPTAVNALPSQRQFDGAESLLGQKVEALYQGTKGNTRRLLINHAGAEIPARVPKNLLPPQAPGATVEILLQRLDGSGFLASV